MNTEFSLDMESRNRILKAFEDLIKEAWDNSEEHGFHKSYDELQEALSGDLQADMRRTSVLAKLGLIASEVGEAVSAVQHDDKTELAFELADVIIRILDLCGSEYINLGPVLLKKMQTNRKRPYMHGKKC